MDDNEIERMIASGNDDLIAPENLSKIVKKEYPFIGKYIRSSNEDVRRLLIYFLDDISQSWCYKWFFTALEDNVGHIRVVAGKGILNLKTVGNVNELISAIIKEHEMFPEKEYATPYLIKAIGNIGDKSDIENLIRVVDDIKTNELSMKEIKESLCFALTKLGDKEANRKVEMNLLNGTPEEKMKALEIVKYTEQKRWVPYVVPLLLEESPAMSLEIGKRRVIKRVCDYAANTLRVIDTDKKLDIEPLRSLPYGKKQIEDIRKIYGLVKEN